MREFFIWDGQVTPVMGMIFLQTELTINECARRRKWNAAGASHEYIVVEKEYK